MIKNINVLYNYFLNVLIWKIRGGIIVSNIVESVIIGV